jgi:hypothetical protein
MRRSLLVGCLLVLAAVAVVVPVGVAQARTPVLSEDLEGQLPAERCGFPITVGVVTNNEYEDVTTLADGTTITTTTGHLVMSFTNDETGKTIVRNVSGPSTMTRYLDASGTFVASRTFVGRGRNWFAFGPNSRANSNGEPGLFFTSGRVTVHGDRLNGTSPFTVSEGGFSLSGTQEDGCALLS